MSEPTLQLDVTGLTAAGIGAAGISEADLDQASEAARAAVDTTLTRRERGDIGFLDVPEDRALARQVMEYARALPDAIDTMVVLGIGGSSLGPHALYSALARPYDQLRPRAPGMPRRLFFPDNVDPVTVAGLLHLCQPQRTVFNVVTKSGGTAETAAQFMVVLEFLQRELGADAATRHLVVTTDPENGSLRRVADRMNLHSFPIPGNVGGRFSVLSAVGLLPAAVAGIDVMGLLDGAAAMRDRVAGGAGCRDLASNPALMLATLLYLHHTRRGRPMHVMMSYVDALYDSADWFRQLWAESLGKARDIDGAEVHVGPTPIAARGATDQHSQLQLYAEGPDDKVFLFTSARQRAADVAIPGSQELADESAYSYLAGRSLSELISAEMRGTIASLRGRGRPCATLLMDRVTAHAQGELLMLLMAATAFAGPLYRVDPYDQPGVEEAKRLAYGALGRPGYADPELQDRLDSALEADPRYVFP